LLSPALLRLNAVRDGSRCVSLSAAAESEVSQLCPKQLCGAKVSICPNPNSSLAAASAELKGMYEYLG